MTKTERAVAMIGYPLATIEATLEQAGWGATAFNVAFAYDHEEAAAFVSDDLDEICADWTGTAAELEFLHGFVRNFAA